MQFWNAISILKHFFSLYYVTEADRENLCEDVFERITEEIAEQWNLWIAMVFHNSKSEVTHSSRRTVELAT